MFCIKSAVKDAARGVTRGDICPRAQHFGGAKLRSECYELITRCQISEDVITVPSPRGVLMGLSPQTKIQAPQIEI